MSPSPVIPRKLKTEMIEQAVEKHKRIYKCPIDRYEMINAYANIDPALYDCFQISHDDKRIEFWFNTEDKSSHMMKDCIVLVMDIDVVEN